jgi:hypothetical protein
MSFGLKNVGATYQRAIQLCLADQLHHNVEAYMDDMVIKTRSHNEFITDLEETFNSLRNFRWKLNPIKCVFGVPQGKLLGFIVSHQGIEANPENITVIIATHYQGRPEAHTLPCSLEQIHLPTWRMVTTLLPIAQTPRQILVNREGQAGIA